MLNAPSDLLTPRLALSAPTAADAAEVFERYATDPEVTRYLVWPRHRSIVDTETFLNFSAEQWRQWPAGPYLVRLRSDGRLIGSTGLTFDASHQPETGYVLAKDSWGQGFATEVLSAMIDLARRIGVPRLYALCHPEQRRSSHVLEKCGFARESEWSRPIEFPNLAPGVLQRVHCYALQGHNRNE